MNSKFLPTSRLKRTNYEDFDSKKYSNNTSKGCVLEVDLEYSEELRELHNEYPLAPDKIEIKKEMLSKYKLMIADIYSIAIGIIKNSVPNFIDKKVCASLQKLITLFKVKVEARTYIVY